MNRDKILKFVIPVTVILLGFLFFLFISYEKQESIETPIEKPVEVIEEKKDQDIVPQTTKSDTQTLFNQKMLEARTFFGKGDYKSAVSSYNQALGITKSEHAYSGLFSAESAQKNYQNAEKAILLAIKENPGNSDYWNWYLLLLKDALNASRSKLDTVYSDAYNKVSNKINIVTQYARILESLGDKEGAIKEWQKAINLNPSMQAVYQSEIDALRTNLQ